MYAAGVLPIHTPAGPITVPIEIVGKDVCPECGHRTLVAVVTHRAWGTHLWRDCSTCHHDKPE